MRAFILVPLYIYPSPNAWTPLLSAARQHPTLEFLVVVNPANGPGSGSAPDSNYTEVLQELRSLPNIKLVGYVYCNWGKRPETELKADIRGYQAWAGPEGCDIHIEGIFIDEAPAGPEHIQYMANAAQYVRKTLSSPSTKRTAAIVIYNPGIFVDQAYYDSADFIIPFENEAAQWTCEYVQENLALLPARLRARSIAVAHTSNGLDQHTHIVEDAVGKHGFAGHFVTGVPGYTEWCCHWDEYVQHAARVS
ncbi:putative cell surface spherulin 4-like protein [Podospora australis]|uniref:Cell surface spherulin 4-like protein n=1 Tax=Podospora australis TaxID=1536484 RepID=A0AAN6X444_9PEZI|nr:putative cell surface spherulin 4-like protein [Podospora australis]